MNRFSKIAIFSIALLSSSIQANRIIEEVEGYAKDGVNATAACVEKTAQLAFIAMLGKFIQENIGATATIEDWFKFLDKNDFIKDHGLRAQFATLAWGAFGATAIRRAIAHQPLRSIKDETGFIGKMIEKLLSLQPDFFKI